MKFYSIDTVDCLIDIPDLSAFHDSMFHGRAERDGKEYPHDTIVWADTPHFAPLQITRTGWYVPPICQPSAHFVVVQALAAALAPLGRLRVVPVEFKKLVDIEFHKGDLSYYDRYGTLEPSEYIKRCPDVPRYHRSVGTYYEVQTWAYRRIIDQYPEAVDFTYESGRPNDPDLETMKFSPRMLEDFGIVWYDVHFVTQAVFDLLAPHIDRDYFTIRAYRWTGARAERTA